MDDTDARILSELRRNARAGLTELSGRLGLARATIRARIARMETAGVIRGFTVLTQDDMAEAPVRAITLLAVEGAGASRITRSLLGEPQVMRVHATNGKWDLIAEIATDTLIELDETLARIRRIAGVTASETNLLLSSRQA